MRHFIDLVTITESMFDMNVPDAVPAEVHEHGGLRFEKQQHGWSAGSHWFVFRDTTPIAMFATDERSPDGLSLHTEVAEPFQRKGYGRIIYDFAKGMASQQGKRLSPSSYQSDAGREFWKKNRDLFDG